MPKDPRVIRAIKTIKFAQTTKPIAQETQRKINWMLNRFKLNMQIDEDGFWGDDTQKAMELIKNHYSSKNWKLNDSLWNQDPSKAILEAYEKVQKFDRDYNSFSQFRQTSNAVKDIDQKVKQLWSNEPMLQKHGIWVKTTGISVDQATPDNFVVCYDHNLLAKSDPELAAYYNKFCSNIRDEITDLIAEIKNSQMPESSYLFSTILMKEPTLSGSDALRSAINTINQLGNTSGRK